MPDNAAKISTESTKNLSQSANDASQSTGDAELKMQKKIKARRKKAQQQKMQQEQNKGSASRIRSGVFAKAAAAAALGYTALKAPGAEAALPGVQGGVLPQKTPKEIPGLGNLDAAKIFGQPDSSRSSSVPSPVSAEDAAVQEEFEDAIDELRTSLDQVKKLSKSENVGISIAGDLDSLSETVNKAMSKLLSNVIGGALLRAYSAEISEAMDHGGDAGELVKQMETDAPKKWGLGNGANIGHNVRFEVLSQYQIDPADSESASPFDNGRKIFADINFGRLTVNWGFRERDDGTLKYAPSFDINFTNSQANPLDTRAGDFDRASAFSTTLSIPFDRNEDGSHSMDGDVTLSMSFDFLTLLTTSGTQVMNMVRGNGGTDEAASPGSTEDVRLVEGGSVSDASDQQSTEELDATVSEAERMAEEVSNYFITDRHFLPPRPQLEGVVSVDEITPVETGLPTAAEATAESSTSPVANPAGSETTASSSAASGNFLTKAKDTFVNHLKDSGNRQVEAGIGAGFGASVNLSKMGVTKAVPFMAATVMAHALPSATAAWRNKASTTNQLFQGAVSNYNRAEPNEDRKVAPFQLESAKDAFKMRKMNQYSTLGISMMATLGTAHALGGLSSVSGGAFGWAFAAESVNRASYTVGERAWDVSDGAPQSMSFVNRPRGRVSFNVSAAVSKDIATAPEATNTPKVNFGV